MNEKTQYFAIRFEAKVWLFQKRLFFFNNFELSRRGAPLRAKKVFDLDAFE